MSHMPHGPKNSIQYSIFSIQFPTLVTPIRATGQTHAACPSRASRFRFLPAGAEDNRGPVWRMGCARRPATRRAHPRVRWRAISAPVPALAPPAAKVPPKRVEIINHREGNPSSATIMVGTVVMSNNSTTRSFIKAMKPSNLLFSEGAETVSFPIL